MDNTNYIQFWSLFIESNVYTRLRFKSQNELAFNVIFTEFVSNITDAKIALDKTPDARAIQKSLDIIFLTSNITEDEQNEINMILDDSGLSPLIFCRETGYVETHSYDNETNSIIVPQPHSSWSLDGNKVWQPPIPCPGDPYSFWDEDLYQSDNTQGWVVVPAPA